VGAAATLDELMEPAIEESFYADYKVLKEKMLK
jgi:hypothetical protein